MVGKPDISSPGTKAGECSLHQHFYPIFDSISSAQIVAKNACFKIATEKGRNRGVFEEGNLAGKMLVKGFLKRSFGLD